MPADAPQPSQPRVRPPTFPCPECGRADGGKVDRTSRPASDRIIRYRVCPCGYRLLTSERVVSGWRPPPAA